MGIFILPPELILEICSYLRYQDVASLVLTCPRYANLLTHKLYKHVISTRVSKPRSADGVPMTNSGPGCMVMEQHTLESSRFWKSEYILDTLRKYELSSFVSWDISGIPMLHRFAALNAYGVVRMLLGRGANPDTPAVAGDTPLLYAVSKWANWDEFGHMLQLFVDHNADIFTKNSSAGSLLSRAMKYAPEPIVISIINRLPRDLSIEDANSPCHLWNAAWARMERVVELLLERGLSAMGTGGGGKIPLHAAAAVGNKNICKHLIAKMRADGNCISTVNLRGYNALHIALMEESESAAELLLEAGINPFARSDDGKLPIDIVSAHRMKHALRVFQRCVLSYQLKYETAFRYHTHGHSKNVVETVKFLLLLAQHAETRGSHGVDSPLHYYASLHWAIHDKSNRILNVLLNLGYDVHKQGRFGNTCLHTLLASRGLQDCSRHYIEKVRAMITRYQKITTANDRGNTALHYSAFTRDLAVMRLIVQKLDRQAITATNHKGNTALHILVSWHDGRENLPYMPRLFFSGIDSERDMIQLLLNHGVDKNARNQDGKTPMQLAAELARSYVRVEALFECNSNGGISNKKAACRCIK